MADRDVEAVRKDVAESVTIPARFNGSPGSSTAFFQDVVGLPPALELPERGAVFFWCGTRGSTMLGPWSVGSMRWD
jgi:hypothetical protein